MTIFYILFFGILNLLIFSRLTRKIELQDRTEIGLLCILGVLGLIHFVNPFGNVISNKLFLILTGFSLALFIFHYGSRVAIRFNIQVNSGKRDELLFKWYNVWIFYIIYLLIFIFQIATILKN